jgi:hypothetical protein
LNPTSQIPPYRRERFDTPDGDFFTVDFLDSRDKRKKPRFVTDITEFSAIDKAVDLTGPKLILILILILVC